MGLDGLPQQFEQFVDRARAALGGEITAAKNIIAAANAEKSAAQSAVATLQAQCKAAQSQLVNPAPLLSCTSSPPNPPATTLRLPLHKFETGTSAPDCHRDGSGC